ncbi:unnamed protein product [Rotaria socialis]|uniref:Uncharacterized protein n=1 Tax=Rotaria socialis TaxID=392032 RepID=A0A820HBS5_9BILA|nr:unnamed protein product [Rotaria socialis]CAF3701866.1 unnamed protein product [Rotaria socialis]CAF3705755.1 unnamed protein product [Rotaria socialis]CAF4138120.1 unnamed protein product [Rotaria socialis]CAF4290440.1 unnamed protein product [Rotaria socialis]
MNAINRLDVLLSDIVKNEPSTSTNGINQETSIQPLSKLTFPQCDPYPSSVLPSGMVTTVPLPPRRNSSSLKHHHHHHRRRQHHHIDQADKEQQHQPLLNSSTLDDLFRALTLECEQYLAATSSQQNKKSTQMTVQPSSKIQVSVESNDDDYENLHSSKSSQLTTNNVSPLKTSIAVMSPIKRHVVSITITSKVSSPQLISPVKPLCTTTTLVSVAPTPLLPPPSPPPPPPLTSPPTNCQSSDDDAINISSSSTNRKRRRRARKQVLSATTIRSSSSSNERKEMITDKKPIVSKRSCSTDPRYQGNRNSHDIDFISSLSSSQKQRTRRPHRRDISLQHSVPNSERYRENHLSPLSVLLTSTKLTSDFLNNSHQPQQRRSRLESVNQKSSTLIDRLHQQFYRPTPILNNNNNKNNSIPAHRMPSYPVY